MDNKAMAINDVVILDSFKDTTPKESKLNRVREYISEYGKFDEPIVVTDDNVLVDGYTRYLIAKELGVEGIPYITLKEYYKQGISIKPRKYIIGQFKNGTKYYWKIRNKLDVQVGDKVLVANKNGKAVVSVIDVFESDNKDMRKHKPVLKVIERKNNSFCKTDKYK